MPEQWILKIKNGVKSVICPYCGYTSDYPDDYCESCDHELRSPDDKYLVKKEWW